MLYQLSYRVVASDCPHFPRRRQPESRRLRLLEFNRESATVGGEGIDLGPPGDSVAPGNGDGGFAVAGAGKLAADGACRISIGASSRQRLYPCFRSTGPHTPQTARHRARRGRERPSPRDGRGGIRLAWGVGPEPRGGTTEDPLAGRPDPSRSGRGREEVGGDVGVPPRS